MPRGARKQARPLMNYTESVLQRTPAGSDQAQTSTPVSPPQSNVRVNTRRCLHSAPWPEEASLGHG